MRPSGDQVGELVPRRAGLAADTRTPSTSRCPSAVDLVATRTAAHETTRPPSRTFMVSASAATNVKIRVSRGGPSSKSSVTRSSACWRHRYHRRRPMAPTINRRSHISCACAGLPSLKGIARTQSASAAGVATIRRIQLCRPVRRSCPAFMLPSHTHARRAPCHSGAHRPPDH